MGLMVRKSLIVFAVLAITFESGCASGLSYAQTAPAPLIAPAQQASRDEKHRCRAAYARAQDVALGAYWLVPAVERDGLAAVAKAASDAQAMLDADDSVSSLLCFGDLLAKLDSFSVRLEQRRKVDAKQRAHEEADRVKAAIDAAVVATPP